MRREKGGELADPFGVAAPGEADKEFAADAQNVAAFEGAGKSNGFEFSKSGQRLGERRRLAAARFCSERQDHGQFIEYDGGIFDEHGVGKIGLGGKRNDKKTQYWGGVREGGVVRLGGGEKKWVPGDGGKV